MGWFRRRKAEPTDLKQKILTEKIDFGSVITSAFYAKPLYDELKVKYHPDRFLDEAIRTKANELFQQIVENRENYDALAQLKEQAEKELPI